MAEWMPAPDSSAPFFWINIALIRAVNAGFRIGLLKFKKDGGAQKKISILSDYCS